jgi:hypothetical protein
VTAVVGQTSGVENVPGLRDHAASVDSRGGVSSAGLPVGMRPNLAPGSRVGHSPGGAEAMLLAFEPR